MVADRLRMSRYVPPYAGKYSGIAPVESIPASRAKYGFLLLPVGWNKSELYLFVSRTDISSSLKPGRCVQHGASIAIDKIFEEHPMINYSAVSQAFRRREVKRAPRPDPTRLQCSTHEKQRTWE
jgi:hypothetical protein